MWLKAEQLYLRQIVVVDDRRRCSERADRSGYWDSNPRDRSHCHHRIRRNQLRIGPTVHVSSICLFLRWSVSLPDNQARTY